MTNQDTFSENKMNIWLRGGIYFLSFGLLFLLYTYNLQNIGPYDFDSTKNFLISEEIYYGDFSRLFSHAAPLFHLVNTGIYAIDQSFLTQEYFSAICVIFSVVIFCGFAASAYKLSVIEELLLILITGTGTFMVNMASYISIEPLSLLIFTFLLIQLYRYPLHHPLISAAACAILTGILLTINYKTLLLFPVLGIIALIWHREIFKPLSLLLILTLLILPYFIVTLTGVLFLSHNLLDPLKALYVVAVIKDVNPLMEVGPFNTDVLFYFKYLWSYENPIMLGIILASPFLFKKEIFNRTHNPVLIQLMAIFIFYFILLMSCFQKAPRGLFLIYDMFGLLLFWTISRFADSKSLKYTLLICFVLYQVYLVNHNILIYRDSNYAKMGKMIDKLGIKEIGSSASINIVPFLEKTKVNLEFSEKDIKSNEYLLLDHYYLVAGLNSFDSLAQYMPEANTHFRERTLEAPLLFLENCEYSGLSFEQAMQNRDKVMTDTFHLSVVKIK